MRSNPQPVQGSETEVTGEFQPEQAGPGAPPSADTGTLDETGAFVPADNGGADDDGATGAWQSSSFTQPPATGMRAMPPGTNSPVTEETGAYVHPESAGADRTEPIGMTRGRSEATGRVGADQSKPVPPTIEAGRFSLKKFHARGGMGEVWLAEDCDIGRQVALKKMRSGREHQRDTFLLEARITGQLEHPGVIPVHELGLDENNQPFYVMKFVHGRTLKDAIDEYHAPPPADSAAGAAAAGTATQSAATAGAADGREVQRLRLLSIFIDLCQTIAYAHSRGVLHRDIKPENVMVGAYGETLVLDWGLAKVIGNAESSEAEGGVGLSFSGSTATAAGAIKGTPSYLAPEATSGKVEDVDRLSDVFLLGGTLYHILTGRPPRHVKKINELLQAVKQPPPAPRMIDRTIPKPLEAICVKALAIRKEDRYQSAAELAEDVQCYLAGEPVAAYRENLAERAWRGCKRRHRLLGRGAAAALILAMLGYGTLKFQEYERLQEIERQKRAEAEETARELQRQETARGEAVQFRRLADEARFLAANADPIGENAPFFDPEKGTAAGRQALAITENWGPSLEQFPLDDRRGELREELYDLLLLMAHVKNRRGSDAATAKETLALLDRASAMREPTLGYHRLRHASLTALGEKDKAAAARAQAADGKTPATALDHFLAAEQLRVESVRPAEGRESRKDWKFDRDKLAEAIAAYRQALRADPDHYWSAYQLGRSLVSLGRTAEGVEALGACVALRPEAPWGYSARGLALMELKRYDEAKADLDQAVALAPDFGPSRLNRGVLLADREHYKAALADFDAALEAPPERRLIEAAFLRGQVFMKTAQFDKALAEFDRVVEAKRVLRPLHKLRAQIHLHFGNAEEALADLDAMLAAGPGYDPKSAEAHALRGRHLHALAHPLDRGPRLGALKLAQVQLEKAVELVGKTAKSGFEPAELFEDLGDVRKRLGDRRGTIEAYTRAIAAAPEDAKLYVKRGRAHEQHDPPLYAEAEKDFAQAVRLDPKSADGHAGLGYAQACLRRDAAAHREANLAVLHALGDYFVIHNVACIYAKLAENDRARTDEYEQIAVDHLRRCIELWEKGAGPHPVAYIRVEPAFGPSLRKRADFQELLREAP
jgi:tetratricopeptide (TPR) repeat protein